MTKRDRLYWRNGRAWADFRDFTAEGGKREPLIPKGAKRATTDPDIAQVLLAARLYARILDEIERAGYDVFTRRAHLTFAAKLRALPRVWAEARRL